MHPGHHILPPPARRTRLCRQQAAMLVCAALCLATVAASDRSPAQTAERPGPLTRLAQDVAGAALTLNHAWTTLAGRATPRDGE